jgi:DNA-binding GntR family transcriptional regulator
MPDERELLPPYLKIAADIEAEIRSGELAPGAAVPSLGRLSQEYGVARNTVVRAMTVLKEKGLITTRQGWGTFVVLPATLCHYQQL